MIKEVKAPDYGELAKKENKNLLATLCMYIAGVDVKELLAPNTFYKHKKELAEFGYDISNRNLHMLQPKVKIITLEPAGVPDFYRHHEPLKPVAVQKHSNGKREEA